MLKINKIESIRICNILFAVKWNPEHDGGEISLRMPPYIEIGCKDMDRDPIYTLGVIQHEVLEAIFTLQGCRYLNLNEERKYLFSFNHQEFEYCVGMLTECIELFLDQEEPQPDGEQL